MKKSNLGKGILLLAVLAVCGIVLFRGIKGNGAGENQEGKQKEVFAATPTAAVQETDVPLQDEESPSPESSDAAVIKKHKDGGAVWTYNTGTRCLVISGEGKICTGEGDKYMVDPGEAEYPWRENCYRPLYYNKVEKIVIESGITSINEGAFYGYSSLKSVELPDTVTKLKKYTFSQCKSLEEIRMGKNLKTFNKTTFEGCPSLQAILLDNANPYFILKSGVLYNRQKTVLYLCPRNKKQVAILPGTREIAKSAFAYCKNLHKVTIPATIEQLYDNTFKGCSKLERVTFAANSRCRQIGYGAFQECRSLRELRLPDSVERVGVAAFRDCKSLQRVYLGSSFLGCDPGGEVLFSNNKKLKKVTVSAANPKYSSQDGVLYNKNKTKLLYYPRAKRDKKFNIPDTVETVRASSFEETRYLEEVTFPKSLKLIGYNAFTWSKSLKAVKIRGKDVIIRSRAFSMCQSLVQVTLEDGIKEIRDEVFLDNPDLKEIHIPASVVKIGKDALGIWLYRENFKGGGGRVSNRDVDDFTIYGKKGSVAQKYARNHVFDFVAEK